MRALTDVRRRAADERGAVLVITVLTLIAMMGMLVLTIDVGGLLLRRRAMVNGADAAALAAAKACVDTKDTANPEVRADQYAGVNVSGLTPSSGGITTINGCDSGSGWLTVQYQTQQQLFFAEVLGFGSSGGVTTAATSAWGPAGGAFAVPIVIDSGYLQGTCKVPDGIQIDQTCALWYNNGNSSLGAANWGYMNLDQWDVTPTTNCSNAGSSSRAGWVINGYPDLRLLNGDPPGTQPTYVCGDTGHTTSDWSTLQSQIGKIKYFPVNDCSGQLDKSGNPTPCPSTPDKYDIIGFTQLLVQAVYKGNDPLAIGSPGASGTCTLSTTSFTNGQVKNLADAYGTGGGCPASVPDNLPSTGVHVFPKKGAEYLQCAPGDLSSSCAYWYDPVLRQITWRTTNASNLKVQFDWSMNGTPGACGSHPSDPNAICLVTQWKGFITGPGPVGGGKNLGAGAVDLCDRTLGTCPDQ